MAALAKWLDGKKTIIGVVAGACVYVARSCGWLDEQTADYLLAAVAIWTGVSLRIAIGKSGGAK